MPNKQNEAPNASQRSALALIIFLDALGLGIIQPILPFLALEFGASAREVTQIVGVYALSAFVAAPLLGRLSDRFGRPLVLIIALASASLGYLAILSASTLYGFYASIALIGAASGNESVVLTLATDRLEQQRHVKVIATLGAFRNIGIVSGPLLAAILAFFGTAAAVFELTITASFLIAIGTFVVTFFVFRESLLSSQGAHLTETLADPVEAQAPAEGSDLSVFIGLSGTLVVGLVTALLYSVTAIYVLHRFEWGTVELGIILAACTLGVIVSRLVLIPWLSTIMGAATAFGLMASLAGIGLLVAASATNGVVFVSAYIVFATGCSGALIFSASMISVGASAMERGKFMGLNQATYAVATVITAVGSGILFERIGPAAPYFAGVAFLSLASLGALLARQRISSS